MSHPPKVADRRRTTTRRHVVALVAWALAPLAAGCGSGDGGGNGVADSTVQDGSPDGDVGGSDVEGGSDAISETPLPSNWSELNVGGGGNDSGLSISAKGVRFVRGDVFGGWAWGKDNRYHQVVTLTSMPAADLGLSPTTNTSDNQAWNGSSGVMELAGCPSSASCAYMYFNGLMYFSSNVDTANLGALKWCRAGDFKQTEETANNVVAAGDPSQFMAIDPANPDHVIVGTPSTGLFETFNGQSCGTTTWTAIPATSIPLGKRSSNSGPYPSYAVAFDPTSATQACHAGSGTCSSKAYVFTAGGGTPGVYMTTDAGRSWVETSGGPTTVQHLKVSAATAGGGHVWATDTSANAWLLIGTSWQEIDSLKGHAGDVAINPSNGDHVITSGGYVSVNGASATPTFVGYKQHFSGAGDAPWQAWTNLSKLTGPSGMEFDPLSSGGDTLIATAGQGVWKTTFPTGEVTWTAETAGIEGLVGSQIAVSAAQSPSIGAGDESGCRFTIATAGTTPSTCFPQASMLLLSYSHGLSTVPGQNLMVSKNSPDYSGGFDSSGLSTDGFASDYKPFNLWNTTVPATALASNGSTSCPGGTAGGACTRVTVPSTAGLKSFAPGDRFTDKSIVCALSTLEYWSGSFGGEGRCYPITVVDSTHFDLTYPYYGSTQSTAGYTYTFWVPAAPLDDWNGMLTITDVTNDSGHVKITTNVALGVGANWPVCISGVKMAGATVVNGCWIATNPTSTTFDLADSVYVSGDSYTTGGVAKTWGTPGGGVAASTATEWSIYGADKTFPLCTKDAGATWTQIRTADDAELSPAGATVVGTVSAGATSLTASAPGLSGPMIVKLTSGRWFHLTGDSGGPPSVSGTNVTFSGAAVPPGDSVPDGAKLYTLDTGWAWAAFLFNHMIVADQVTPNTFYGVNYNAGLMKWTDCGAPTVIVPRGPGQVDWYAWISYNASLKAVPKEAGHLFLAAGPQGSATHPTSSQLSRMCNAASSSPSWQRVTGIFEPQAFGFGAPAAGHSYSTEYVVGWYSATDNIKDAQYGIWESVDDPNDGATGSCNLKQTWTNIGTAAQNAPGGFPLGWFSNAIDISGDPFVHGPVYYSGGFGAFYGVFP